MGSSCAVPGEKRGIGRGVYTHFTRAAVSELVSGHLWGERVRLSLVSVGDQVIRENPANRGTETSAEVLVGPPGRME